MSLDEELDAVTRWCDKTDQIAIDHFRRGPMAELKPDGTLVTLADRNIESALRAGIAGEFPGDAVLGEEQGLDREGAPRRWIIDPIDATTNYVRGIAIFATLIALEDAEGLALGIVSAPGLAIRWWAVRGEGAYRNDDAIRVSQVSSLADAHVATGGLELFAEHGTLDGALSVIRSVPRHRGFGDFYGHMLVAQGSVEAMIDPVVAPWDLAACQIIVEEAGGRFTNLKGEPGYDGGDALSSNGLVHDQVLSRFTR